MNFHPRFALLSSTALALTLSLAGCKSNSTPQNQANSSQPAPAQPTAAQPASPDGTSPATGQPAIRSAQPPAKPTGSRAQNSSSTGCDRIARGNQYSRSPRHRSRLEDFAARRFVHSNGGG